MVRGITQGKLNKLSYNMVAKLGIITLFFLSKGKRKDDVGNITGKMDNLNCLYVCYRMAHGTRLTQRNVVNPNFNFVNVTYACGCVLQKSYHTIHIIL